MRAILLLSLCLLCAATSRSQRLPAADLGRKQVAVQYENDLFNHTDYYYTQGLQLSLAHPSLQHFFLSKALLRLHDTVYSAGLAIEQDCYTPTSILSDTILRGDRPFAAGLMLNYHITSGKGRSKLTSRLSVGVVGAAAGGYEMQKGIHEHTGNIIPHGWQYQISNDAILNYEAAYSYQLLRLQGSPHYLVPDFYVLGLAVANAGTYLNKLSLGASINAGFTNSRSRPDFYLCYEVKGAAIGYDATMQGGLFNRSSPYTISAGQIERATFQQRAGITVRYGALQLQGSYTMLSKEFDTGQSHAWGGLSAAVAF